MTVHDIAHELLLTGSDLPRRLDEARRHPRYEAAMVRVPKRPSSASIVIATIGLGACGAFPWLGIAVSPDPPVWLIASMAVLSLLPLMILRWGWRRWRSMTRGSISRELYAVIDCTIEWFDDASRWYVTLWNREQGIVRMEHPIGVPHLRAGDVGVAVFRDEHLVEVIRIPAI